VAQPKLEQVLVTGTTGFIGAAVLRELIAGGHSVEALVRTEAAAEAARAAGASSILGDLLAPTPAMNETIAAARYVVHCAQPKARDERPRMDANLLEAIDLRRVARFVYVGGSSYIGRAEGKEWLDENSPRHPIGIGATFEESIRALRAAGERGLDYAVALVGGVYGNGSWFIQAYLHALAVGEPIPVLNPAPRWPYVHIDDCARAIVHLMTVDRSTLASHGREVIVADDMPMPMDLFIEEVGRVVGKQASLRRLDEATLRAEFPPVRVSYLTADMPHSNRRLRQLGFTCRYPSPREGLATLGLTLPRSG
jgi:nucleoside-diphosphate-sugar epimerase